jgi:predicted Zn-dependent protease
MSVESMIAEAEDLVNQGKIEEAIQKLKHAKQQVSGKSSEARRLRIRIQARITVLQR